MAQQSVSASRLHSGGGSGGGGGGSGGGGAGGCTQLAPAGTQSPPHDERLISAHHVDVSTGYSSGKLRAQPEHRHIVTDRATPSTPNTVSGSSAATVHDDGHAPLSAQQSVSASRLHSGGGSGGGGCCPRAAGAPATRRAQSAAQPRTIAERLTASRPRASAGRSLASV